MTKQEFAKQLQTEMIQKMGETVTVCLREVCKNNGVTFQGLLIMEKNSNAGPTIYLDTFWDCYLEGMPLVQIVDSIIQIYRQNQPEIQVDMDFFQDFNKVKDRIAYKLIHAEKNKLLLEQIPYVPLLDLAICFYYVYFSQELGNGIILIHNSHMKMWNTNTTELMRLAERNTRKLLGEELIAMEQLVKGWSSQCEPANLNAQQNVSQEMPLYILSNHKQLYGAACILYQGLLSEIAQKWNADLLILPSSVHEVILLPDDGKEDIETLREMVCEVNSTEVGPEEILSNQVYHYDRENHKIFIKL